LTETKQTIMKTKIALDSNILVLSKKSHTILFRGFIIEIHANNKIMHFVIANIVEQSVSLLVKVFKLNCINFNLQQPLTYLTSGRSTKFLVLEEPKTSLRVL
jgi:hypothetical protein